MATKSTRKSVAFANKAPEIHEIPAELSSWAEGEYAEHPSDADIRDAKSLVQSAERAIEEEDRRMPTSLPSRNPFNNTSRPRLEAVQCGINYVKRKAVPSRSQSTFTPLVPECSPPSYEDLYTADSMPARIPTSHSFEQFLPPDKVLTWKEEKPARSRNLRPLQTLATAGFHKMKKEAVKFAASVEEVVNDRNVSRRGMGAYGALPERRI